MSAEPMLAGLTGVLTVTDDTVGITGPFPTPAEAAIWGANWSRQHGDDPRWQTLAWSRQFASMHYAVINIERPPAAPSSASASQISMKATTGLLAPALRECAEALQALDATRTMASGTTYGKAMDAARSACTTARIKAEAALKLYDARLPASAWD